MAGFCRHLGVGVEELGRQMRERQEELGALLAIFEDEALNSGLSPTVISAYLKCRLGYGEKTEERTAVSSEGMQLIFEHDIFEDGG